MGEEAFIIEFYSSELEKNSSFVVNNNLRRLKNVYELNVIFKNMYNSFPLSEVSLSAVSLTHSQPQSENIKWRILEVSHL